jgi:Ca2+-binding RTX toxin-like protein
MIMAVVNGTIFSDNGSSGTGFPLLGTGVADILNANWSAGSDWMFGGAGNDEYRVNSTGDVVAEASGNGTDTIVSRVANFTLASNFENLTLDNTAGFLTALTGTGNSFANTIIGNSNANTLSGLGGNDVINAGAGADLIIGGSGKDTMTDGGGSDVYDFNSTSESAVGVNRDICTDFTHNVDTINLATIDADLGAAGNQAFTFIGNVAFDGTAGQVRYFLSGANIIIQVELHNDGNQTADM